MTIENERAIIQCVFLDNGTLDRIHFLGTDDFTDPKCRTIYSTMKVMREAGLSIDQVTLHTSLKEHNKLESIGGVAGLIEFGDVDALPVNAEQYAEDIVRASRRKKIDLAYTAEDFPRLRSAIDDLDAVHELRRDLISANEFDRELEREWSNQSIPMDIGLKSLNRKAFGGGLRAGQVVAIAGGAGRGKSALAGQLAYDACRLSGAVIIYATVEMPGTEIYSRWLALESYRLGLATPNEDIAIPYSDIFYGKIECKEGRYESETIREAAIDRLAKARVSMREFGHRLYPTKIDHGSTVATLRSLMREARAKHPGAPALLVVDPLQRLFASATGARSGRTLDAINSAEISRVEAVAAELKSYSDSDGFAVIFTSDTTKSSAKSGDPEQGLRGSYQLNHMATHVFGMASAKDTGDDKQLKDEFFEGSDYQPNIERPKEETWKRADTLNLGKRIVLLKNSKIRTQDTSDGVFLGFVPGACCFVETSTKR